MGHLRSEQWKRRAGETTLRPYLQGPRGIPEPTAEMTTCRRPAVCHRRRRPASPPLATAIVAPQLSLLEPVLHGGEKVLALAVVAIWSLTIALPVPEVVRNRVSIDNNAFRFGLPLPWRGAARHETRKQTNAVVPEQNEHFVLRQLRDNLAKMGVAMLAIMQPAALVPPIVSAVDDTRRRYFDSARPPFLFPWLQPSRDTAPTPTPTADPPSSDNLFVKVITSPFRLFSPAAPRTIAMTSPLLPNPSAHTELSSKSEQETSSTNNSIVHTSFAMVTLAAAAVVQPAALIGPFINIFDSRSRSSSTGEEHVATATYTPASEQLLMRVRSFFPQLSLPFFGTTLTSDQLFESWSFELPQFDIPRIVGRIRMAVAVHNAAGLNHEQAHPFKLNGLRWHHCAISNHLRALEKRAAGGASGAELEAAYSFVFAKIWRTYNNLERDILFPWLVAGTENDVHVQRAVNEFATERARIERSAARVGTAIRAVAQNDPLREQQNYAAVSNVRHERLARQLSGLAADVERLHKAERDVLFPIIAARFDVAEQRRLTNRMVDAMENRLSRLQLVNYYENIKDDPVQVAHFKDEVPAPLRALLGFWKMSYYDGTPLEALSKN